LVKTIKKIDKNEIKIDKKVIQPEINIGLVGHVDHGKTTITQALSGVWTDTHSEEIKRGITIRLGYANVSIYKCSECKNEESYSTNEKCKICGSKAEFQRKISLVDAPGHETLMATMLSGAAIMDCALLVIAANEECPQPQTKEHLMALEITGISNIIIVQNKIDLVTEEQAKLNYDQINNFVKGSIAKDAPIIPISAQHNINIENLLETIQLNFKTPKRDLSKDPIMYIARSFDVNKPGLEVRNLVGGILGGTLKHGKLKLGDKVEIRPGIKIEKEGRTIWQSLETTIVGLKTGTEAIDEVIPGGSIAVLTELDPLLLKSDSLTGNILGHPKKLPNVFYELKLEPKLLERIVGAKDNLVVAPIKKEENLMLNVNSATTLGTVIDIKKNIIHVKLRLPVCADVKDRITISRVLNNRWRLIGYSNIIN